jgi:hypothetical protein
MARIEIQADNLRDILYERLKADADIARKIARASGLQGDAKMVKSLTSAMLDLRKFRKRKNKC